MEVLRKRWQDKEYVGFVLGTVGPILGLAIYCTLLSFADGYRSPYQFFMQIYTSKGLQSGAVAVSLFFNLLLLVLAFKWENERLAKGVLMASIFLYMPVVLFLKFY